MVCLGVLQCRTVTKAQTVTVQEKVTDKLFLQTSEATVDIAKNITKVTKMSILFDAPLFPDDTATLAAVQTSGFLGRDFSE